MKKRIFKAVWALMLLSTGLAGCSSLTHSKDEAAVNQVKRVAVVGFSAYEPASAGIGLNLGSGKIEGKAGGSMIAQYDTHVDQMLEELLGSMGKNTGWSVMPLKSMKGHKGYLAAYDKTMKGWQNKMPPGEGMKHFNVKEVMDYDSGRILDVKGRDELIEALGVDAIVVARVDVGLNGTTVMGIGSRRPQSRLSFSVYKRGVEKPVWFEGKIDGEESEQSVGKTGFIDEKLLGELALKSAKTAFAKIGASSVQ